ncbi:MAG: hypothetical protein WBN96_04600, partial [Gammaproteobacteria bacterium]
TCVLFMSLALAALPVQQAFAAMDMDSSMDTQSSHCQDKATSDTSAQRTDLSAVGSISHGCCCDQCDANCASGCGHGMTISAIMLPPTTAVTNSAHPVYQSTCSHFTTRSTSPPSPPPLS